MSHHLVKDILTGIWLMNDDAAIGYAPQVLKILEGHHLTSEEVSHEEAFAVNSQVVMGRTYTDFSRAPEGSIAVVPFQSALYKYDVESGPRGMMTKSDVIARAANEHNISGIILNIDSPGGAANGPEIVQQTINKVKERTEKPVIAFVSGMAASAAYWIASQADEIIMNHGNDQVGSIGTMASFIDIRPYIEKQGAKVHEIFATESTKKQGPIREALKGNYDPLRKEELDPLNESFHSAVKEGRSGRINEGNKDIWAGALFRAEEAISQGLADAIGDFEYAVERAEELAKQRGIIQEQNNMTMSQNNQYTLLMTALGVSAMETDKDGYAHLGPEQLQAIEDTLKTKDDAKAQAETDKQNAQTAKKTAETQVSELKELFGEQAKAEDFELKQAVSDALVDAEKHRKADGGRKSEVGKADDEVEADEEQKKMDELEHNKAIDGNPLFEKTGEAKN